MSFEMGAAPKTGAGDLQVPRGPGSLPPWLRGDSQHTLFSLPFEISLSETGSCLWIGSSAGLLIFNLASFELEGVLHYKGKTYVQRILDTGSM